MTDRFHETNRRRWEAGAATWARRADSRGIWKKCHRDPSLALHSAELAWLRDIAGKRIAVLGSGDHQVVFALCGMGAKVTSIDICKRQLDIARRRAAVLGAAVDFVCADVVDLSALGDAAFDVVYTGGHVAVWVSDLERYYREATRLLRPDGLLIVSEYHPFRRIWRRAATLEIGTDYFDRGPHRFHAAADVLNHESGELEQFEFHWTVADYISAILGTHCRLIHVEEFGASCEAWEGAPIPACRNHCCWSPAATPDAAHAFMYLRSQYRHRGAVCGIGICHPAMPRDPLRQFPSEGATVLKFKGRSDG